MRDFSGSGYAFVCFTGDAGCCVVVMESRRVTLTDVIKFDRSVV